MLLALDMASCGFAHELHPSMNASMDDFEAREFSPTIPELPSQHSGFRSNVNSDYSDTSSKRSFSPPAWRKAGSGWFRHQQSPARTGFNSASPPYLGVGDEHDDGDITAYRTASRIPLPESPIKGRSPSPSPDPVPPKQPPEHDEDITIKKESAAEDEKQDDPDRASTRTPTQNNYIRFSTSLDVVQRTEPIEAMAEGVRKAWNHVTKSRYNTLLYALSTLGVYWILANLLATPTNGPSPDLIKVAALAKSFEPAIYYSEAGQGQINQLHETSIAVWDLGESMRSSNMTSAPMIVNQLDSLSESLKELSMELTQFFTNVDADVDSIINSMEWAQRELGSISSSPPGTISAVWSNVHTMLTNAGLASQSEMVQQLFGQTYQQRTKAALERTFHDFLGALEEAINNELTFSMRLFGLFEAIDKQFLNLQRTVVREQDQQERIENEFLGSLWTKVMGLNAGQLRKYEKNRDLLRSVRDRTVGNKRILQEHNQRLLQLKSNLEVLRQKLVSPLVRSTNSSTLSVENQIKGLESTYSALKQSREQQKLKIKEVQFGIPARHVYIDAGKSTGSGAN